MKTVIKQGLLALMLLSVISAKAQVATSLYFMDNLPQSSILNPAFSPNYNFYFGLPVINNTYVSMSSDIGLGNLYNSESASFAWNSQEDYTKFVNDLPEVSFFSTELNTNVFSMGFALNEGGYFHLGVNHRIDVLFGLPRAFFKLNDLTVNHDLSGFEMSSRWYSEYYMGFSKTINDNLTVGAKFKLLAGIANANMAFDRFDFNTQSDQWSYNIVGAADISGPIDVILDDDGVPQEVVNNLETDDYNEVINFAAANFSNTGFGVDLGVEYQVIPQLKLSASLVDLGKINWKDEVQNLNITGEYAFNGLEDIITTDTDDGVVAVNDNAIEDLTDTISNSIHIDKSFNVFDNRLSPKLFLAAEYELTQALSVGALYKTRFVRDEVRQNLYLNVNANFKRFLTLGANYNYGFNSQNSYGGVIGLRMAAFYLYFAADVIPGYAASGGSKVTLPDGELLELPISLPSDFNAANFQFGVNITLGERRRQMAKRERKEKLAPTLLPQDLENSSIYYPF